MPSTTMTGFSLLPSTAALASSAKSAYEQLEAEDAERKMVFDVTVSGACLAHRSRGFVDLLDESGRTCRRSISGWVEDEGVGVGQAQGMVEAGLHEGIQNCS
jgi:hypothetical protein